MVAEEEEDPGASETPSENESEVTGNEETGDVEPGEDENGGSDTTGDTTGDDGGDDSGDDDSGEDEPLVNNDDEDGSPRRRVTSSLTNYDLYDRITSACREKCGGRSLIRLPSNRMFPSSGVSKPAIKRSIVVFPQPEGPSSVMNSLSRI